MISFYFAALGHSAALRVAQVLAKSAAGQSVSAQHQQQLAHQQRAQFYGHNPNIKRELVVNIKPEKSSEIPQIYIDLVSKVRCQDCSPSTVLPKILKSGLKSIE
jgi:hypothetical protein